MLTESAHDVGNVNKVTGSSPRITKLFDAETRGKSYRDVAAGEWRKGQANV